MPNQFVEEKVDIYKLPKINGYKSNKGAQITIGDIHGNAIKFLYVLARHGIAKNISDEDYNKLVVIYKTPVQSLKKNDLDEFNQILDKINFSGESTIRLIGDELADRGNNDYFTLKILEKLDKNNVKTEILLSNHSVEFINNYEKDINFKKHHLRHGQAASMQKMQVLLDNKIIEKNEIKSIVDNVYKKSLKAISYTLSEDKKEISIYSHAPIGLDNIKNVAKKLNVNYDDSTTIKLAETIEEINNKFQSYVIKNEVNTLCDLEDPNEPFNFLMWNRNYNFLNRPEENNNYKLNFIHGHDSGEKTLKNIYNLDNDLGKAEALNNGTYTFTYSHDIQLDKKKEFMIDNLEEKGIIENLPKKAEEKKDIQQAPNYDEINFGDLLERSGFNKFLGETQEIQKKYKQGTEKNNLAGTLYETLKNQKELLIDKKINVNDFYTNCSKGVETAQNSSLGKESGLKSFFKGLANALIAVVTLGIANLATGRFSIVKTQSDKLTNKFKDMRESLNQIKNANSENVDLKKDQDIQNLDQEKFKFN